MSKHKLLHSEAANGSLGHPLFLPSYNPTWITVAILELASKLRTLAGKSAFFWSKTIWQGQNVKTCCVQQIFFYKIAFARSRLVLYYMSYQAKWNLGFMVFEISLTVESGRRHNTLLPKASGRGSRLGRVAVLRHGLFNAIRFQAW